LLSEREESVEVGQRVDQHHHRLLDLAGITPDRLAVPMQHAELMG
jgi:hypothetical protein